MKTLIKAIPVLILLQTVSNIVAAQSANSIEYKILPNIKICYKYFPDEFCADCKFEILIRRSSDTLSWFGAILRLNTDEEFCLNAYTSFEKLDSLYGDYMVTCIPISDKAKLQKIDWQMKLTDRDGNRVSSDKFSVEPWRIEKNDFNYTVSIVK